MLLNNRLSLIYFNCRLLKWAIFLSTVFLVPISFINPIYLPRIDFTKPDNSFNTGDSHIDKDSPGNTEQMDYDGLTRLNHHLVGNTDNIFLLCVLGNNIFVYFIHVIFVN